MPQIQQAFNDLRNALWMLAIPLAFSCYGFFTVCQWNAEELQNQANPVGVLEEVPEFECVYTPRPEGAICGSSSDWWYPVDPSVCGGTAPCYEHAGMADAEDEYLPLFMGGILPILFIVIVMRKVGNARSALREVGAVQ